MNAAQPQPSAPKPAPKPGEVIPPEHKGKDQSALIQDQLDDNSLYQWLRSLPAKVKSGSGINPKILGGVLLVALAGGIWWWYSGESKKTEAARWKETASALSPAELDKVAKDFPDTPQALVARRNAAELQFGTEGTAKLDNGETRTAAIESIEKAREEFLKLAEAFGKLKDKSLQTVCLRMAGDAELSLVGIPKAGVTSFDWDESQDRGTVAKAVEYYRQAAVTIGDKTTAGERYTKLADQLLEKSKRSKDDPIPSPRLVGVYLHQQIKAKLPEIRPKTPTGVLPPVGPPPETPGTTPKTPTTIK